MSLASEIWELVRAGFSGIWVETHEPSEAILPQGSRRPEFVSLTVLVMWSVEENPHG